MSSDGASMWVPSTVCLDEPIMVLFWEVQDFQLLVLSAFLLPFFIGPFWAFGGALAFAIGTYMLKRGKPAGALLHFLHHWGFWKLPGVLGSSPQRYGSW